MKARDIVKDIIKKQDLSCATIAHRMNMTLAASWDLVSNPKRNPEMTTKVMIPLLNALDHKLVVLPRDAKIPEGGYLVD